MDLPNLPTRVPFQDRTSNYREATMMGSKLTRIGTIEKKIEKV